MIRRFQTLARWQTLLGAVLGLLLAAGAMSLWHGRSRPGNGAMIADYGGPLRRIVMQYSGGADFTWPVFHEFLRQQSPTLTVYIVCPEEADFAELRDHLGPLPVTLTPLYTHHEMTPWSRDRWVLLAASDGGAGSPISVTMLAPKGELQQETWKQRAGDSRIAEDISRELHWTLAARRSGLYFDAGDYLADGPFVFVSPQVLRRNLQHTVETREDLLRAIREDLGKEPLLMDNAPEHHIGMYMMSAGHNTMVVADPSLGQASFTPTGPAAALLPGGPDFSAPTQQRFDAAATAATSKGFHVVRIPVAPSRTDSKVYLTYVNVMLDAPPSPSAKPLVYMPIFAGQTRMNAAAQKVWESLGYEVRPIDCTTTFTRGGNLHCLVNVLERGPN